MEGFMNTADRVIKIVEDEYDYRKNEVTPDMILANEGIDSLDLIWIAMELEAEFEIDIPDEETHQWKTVQDIINYIDRR